MSWMNPGSTGSFPRTSTVNGNMSSFVQQPQSTNMGNYGTVGGVFTSGSPPIQAAPVSTYSGAGIGGMGGGGVGYGGAASSFAPQATGYGGGGYGYGAASTSTFA